MAHRLPFPPDRGDKIRSHHVLKALAQIAPVHVGCLAEDAKDAAHKGELAAIATSHCMPRRSKQLALAGIEALGRGEPVSFSAFRSKQLHDWVKVTLAERNIRAIYVFSGQMAQYVPEDWKRRLIVDLVDVDSAKFEAYAAQGSGLRGWIDAREGKLLRAIESELAKRADATLLVSEAEANLLRERAPGSRNIRALRNGIDCTQFDPDAATPASQLSDDGPHYVFTGQMDYAPNVTAVARMAKQIMPRVRKELPQARFHIVGRAPTGEVLKLDGLNGTTVVGEVPDTRPWLVGANAVVAPLTLARGVQNKVLEAMSMAKPVVASPEAATGIDARNHEDILVAADDATFAAHLLQLHDDPAKAAKLGEAARNFVKTEMSWPAMLADLPTLLGLADGGARDAA
ncbi:TIGR03087 family PEP-CTERM/XrtA system glycosyltransferase [Aurantiacibacter sp. D1-12]|uniref:TIGR03087 family PEP-CTERM/XrtA system glycosyltransferase n=1 Tax=Aurantiacibacter sp. D1-12 TaxID=2993658 RepID=UPI00237C7F7D|nr:TIGR03087 family PEP-CTERM/XrtA system glycosyltransferase [Aurantiacibacter sp. D1-12]MDE1466584.1 TIGR03087 family PEP-CTERM/XrtA system glycosyltransferase [Aurantiacibacter sp. D1-12]